jgi:hypothetical protein
MTALAACHAHAVNYSAAIVLSALILAVAAVSAARRLSRRN